ncbi:dihydropteroate synthase [Salinarchaeum sp. IM2453]|uniref:dihydropteroate synthase n=1 Tax=Salinarchaeum sp. IM2453 TaxID=2862870 RepID=UPI001C83C99A|nr:dihydropteroate synthase [Salinarchaeum sp. IM2453]QZA88914.1 dihydropteroate synthase [Salinarchaeum sp. IM2453]
MGYHEATNFLFNLQRFGPQPGITSVRELLSHLGNPHEDLTCIQIAGSNGKGSTARMTERVLREAGYSVGLYISPQIEQFRDRVRVDGRYIPESEVTRFVDLVRPYVTDRGAESVPPTFFEVSTALALWYFAQKDVDVAVLEVGIGGSKDATSVVDPVASAVTSVTLEHSDVLGDTVEEIAVDKAHVEPSNRPIVTGADESALAAIREFVDTDPIVVGDDSSDESFDVQTRYHGKINGTEAEIELVADQWNVKTNILLLGAHQAQNAGIAAVLARQFANSRGDSISTDVIARGLRQAYWPGRCEVRSTDPIVILDGAHNEGACARLADVINEFEYDNLHLVVGAMHDKRHAAMARELPNAERITTCRPQLDRSADPEVLARVFRNAGNAEVSVIESVDDALTNALSNASEDDCVVVTGSLFAVREARARWTRRPIPHSFSSTKSAGQLLEQNGIRDYDVQRTAEKATAHTITLRVNRPQAYRLKELFQTTGGDCAISKINHDGERLRVALMGTTNQFNTVIDQLQDESEGLDQVGLELQQLLADRTQSTDQSFPWDDNASIMGILNITPDSFHDGGDYNRLEDARNRAKAMIDAGVDILDVGGESTRPGADPVEVQREIDRVVPVIEEIADLDAMISVDTRKAAVAEKAIQAGADIINDVSGLEDPDMRFVAAEYDTPLVIMHSIEAPVNPDRDVQYDDVVRDVIEELNERVLLAEQAGLDREQIIIDPGFGFGKTAEESFELLSRLDELDALGCPIMVGHSHKSMFELAGYEHGERLPPTIAATALAADRGADIIRVHDAEENIAAVRTVDTLPEN